MRNDAIRSGRLNFLLQAYLRRSDRGEIFRKAKQMGVTDVTARDYMRTVLIQAKKMQARV